MSWVVEDEDGNLYGPFSRDRAAFIAETDPAGKAQAKELEDFPEWDD